MLRLRQIDLLVERLGNHALSLPCPKSRVVPFGESKNGSSACRVCSQIAVHLLLLLISDFKQSLETNG